MNDSLSQRLTNLYQEHFPTFSPDSWWRNDGMDDPVLIQPPVDYTSADVKIFFVGQQPRGWARFDGPSATRDLLSKYRNFTSKGGARTSFWQIINAIASHDALGRVACCWGNLYKFDEDNKAPSNPRAWYTSRDVLLGELAILDPDVTIFLAGSYTWEVRDICELGMGWKYLPSSGFSSIVGRADEEGETKAIHTKHPNARIPCSRARRVDEIMQLLGE